jgi:hypothetical protein
MTRPGRFFALLLTLLALALGGGGSARADAPIITTPRDAPLVMQPERITIPAPPKDFLRRDEGAWLHVVYPPGVHEQVEGLVREAEEMKARLAADFGAPVLANVDVRVARNPEEMTALAPIELPPFEYAAGMAYTSLHLVLITLQAPGTAESVDLPETFRHELAHVALYDAVAGNHVPRWFNEGLAIHESGEHGWKRFNVLSQATFSKAIIPLAELDRSFPNDPYEVSIAYAESGDFVRFLLRQADRARFAAFLERVRGGAQFERALSDAYTTDMRKLEYEWREDLSKRYAFVPLLTSSGTIIWVLFIGVLAVGWMRRRRRTRAKLEQWQREDDAIDAAIAATPATALARTDGVEHAAPPEMIRPAKLPMVEHDGNWYTLH